MYWLSCMICGCHSVSGFHDSLSALGFEQGTWDACNITNTLPISSAYPYTLNANFRAMYTGVFSTCPGQ